MEKKQKNHMHTLILFFYRLSQMQIPVYAAYACFFIVLSVFPALVLVLGMIRHTNLTPGDLMFLIEEFLPNALEPYLWRLMENMFAHTSRLVLSVSALTAIWSASRGVRGLIRGLNAVYELEEHRSWLQTRILSAVYTVLFLLLILLTLIGHVFGDSILALLRPKLPQITEWMGILDLRYFLLIFLQVMLFSAMYVYFPDRRVSFKSAIPGALFSTFGWMTASSLFSIYVDHFSAYATVYGSVYAVALSLLWLYFCVCIIFYGAVLNRLLSEPREMV